MNGPKIYFTIPLLGGIDNEDNMAALQKLIDQALANDSAK